MENSSPSLKSLEKRVNPEIGDYQDEQLYQLGYTPQLKRTRKLSTMVFMSLSIASIPYGVGSSLMNAVYGGGQLSLFIGLLVVLVLDSCVVVSLSELASRYPTSSGVYHWSFRLLKSNKNRAFVSFVTGWIWLIGNWTISLSVNFGIASLIVATVSIFYPDWTASSWQLLLIFYAICLVTFVICFFGDHLLPLIDTLSAACSVVTCIAFAITMAVLAKAGRHDAQTGLVGLVPVVAGIAAVIFTLPICFTLPPLADIINAPYGQALPYIIHVVTGSPAASIVLMVLVLLVAIFCSISITTTAGRCTWAFSRDNALPLSHLWSATVKDSPLSALCLVTAIEMLLGLIYLGSTSAFTAFASVGVIALAVAYAIPIAISLFVDKRVEVSQSCWKLKPTIGKIANGVALLWIAFQVVLFCMPVTLPVNSETMTYASIVFVGCVGLNFKGPVEEIDGTTLQ
ncbi:Amino acid/polyamine transporter I [Penicillium cosmopolitanum]|uniref:Amino acid/polyamine transporter I n=1 Tax=Penicillium cosmopolitanum TaxID=1131564 RepID=A0A9W9VG07_9EURO|nr:Amino acid/polyamine transporter I [Penicillium cosmopolitanum]KAJ5379404.1 Amino acid/polyamine transporter I [Penicillium cosmopolitanum]